MDDTLIAELKDHIKNPPGGDLSLTLFYSAMHDLYLKNKNVTSLIHRIKKKRKNLTDKHLTNLLFRAYQYLKFETGDLTYKSFLTTKEWILDICLVISDSKSRRIFERILVKKSTQTTIYQRYIGPHAIIVRLFGAEAVNVADFGCGGNFGLRGIEIFESFKPIVDLTPNAVIKNLFSQKINLHEGLAVDKENPDNHYVKKWRMACSFYPIELDTLEEVNLFETRIRKSIKVKFLKANLLTLNEIPGNKFDVIILSMILYELTTQAQAVLINKAKQFLKDDGVIIVQDFAEKSKDYPKLLSYNVSWFGRDFGFRTFITSKKMDWKFKEILKWNNGRCSIVKPGVDFKLLFKDPKNYNAKASRPAFAHSTS